MLRKIVSPVGFAYVLLSMSVAGFVYTLAHGLSIWGWFLLGGPMFAGAISFLRLEKIESCLNPSGSILLSGAYTPYAFPLAFLFLYLLSVLVRTSNLVRPTSYFILIAVISTVVCIQIMGISERLCKPYVILCEILALGINVAFMQNLTYPFFGMMDIVAHSGRTTLLLSEGGISPQTLYGGYWQFPGAFVTYATYSLVTQLGVPDSIFVSMGLSSLVIPISIYSVLTNVTHNRRIGLLAALLYTVNRYEIFFATHSLPQTFGVILGFAIFLSLVLAAIKQDRRFFIGVIPLMFAAIVSHNVTNLYWLTFIGLILLAVLVTRVGQFRGLGRQILFYGVLQLVYFLYLAVASFELLVSTLRSGLSLEPVSLSILPSIVRGEFLVLDMLDYLALMYTFLVGFLLAFHSLRKSGVSPTFVFCCAFVPFFPIYFFYNPLYNLRPLNELLEYAFLAWRWRQVFAFPLVVTCSLGILALSHRRRSGPIVALLLVGLITFSGAFSSVSATDSGYYRGVSFRRFFYFEELTSFQFLAAKGKGDQLVTDYVAQEYIEKTLGLSLMKTKAIGLTVMIPGESFFLARYRLAAMNTLLFQGEQTLPWGTLVWIYGDLGSRLNRGNRLYDTGAVGYFNVNQELALESGGRP